MRYRCCTGGVDPGNAAEILSIAEVNGVLAGRASLDAENFLALIEACPVPSDLILDHSSAAK